MAHRERGNFIQGYTGKHKISGSQFRNRRFGETGLVNSKRGLSTLPSEGPWLSWRSLLHKPIPSSKPDESSEQLDENSENLG